MTDPDSDVSPQPRRLLLVGLGGAMLAAALGMGAPHNGAVWRLPQVLEERVATALLASGHAGLDVEMNGQRAILRGIIEDDGDIAGARRAALRAAGAGGPWAGGITSVDVSETNIGTFERPYLWSVRREASRLVLSGAAPSETARADLLGAAARAFPNLAAADEMHVAGGAPSPFFSNVAGISVRLLAGLHNGEVRIVDAQIVVIGDGDQAGIDAFRATLANPPAPFRARFDVTIDGLDAEHPELQGLNLASGDSETCEQGFDRLMEGNFINFATGSAAIDPASREVLDGLATVALRCDRFSIEVAGHTDDQGGRAMNMELSARRADAVAAYLAGQGVARSRLSARGYGPDRPRVSNANAAGQAQNRRIEFYVRG